MEQDEIKIKKEFLEFLKKEITFTGTAQDIENKRYELCDKLFQIYVRLNPKPFVPPDPELSTVD